MTSNLEDQRTRRSFASFGLFQLLVGTTAIAILLSIDSQRRESQRLTTEIAGMQRASTQLLVDDPSRFAIRKIPSFESGTDVWKVHVPEGEKFQLRFAVEKLSSLGYPAEFETFDLLPGRQEIAMREVSRSADGMQWQVYCNGQPVITIERPGDWLEKYSGSRSSNIGGGGTKVPDELPFSLLHTNFTRSIKIGRWRTQSIASDDLADHLGHQLWIDRVEHSPEAIPDWIVASTTSLRSSRFYGHRTGLRLMKPHILGDRIRLQHSAAGNGNETTSIQMTFKAPSVPALLTQANQDFKWRVSGRADRITEVNLQDDQFSDTISIYLHGQTSNDAQKPVVEVTFDASRPDQISLQLPSIAANANLTHWSLSVLDGRRHHWRQWTTADGERTLQSLADENGTITPRDFSIAGPFDVLTQNESEESFDRLLWSSDYTDASSLFLSPTVPFDQKFNGLLTRHALLWDSGFSPAINLHTESMFRNSTVPISGGPVVSTVTMELADPLDKPITYRIEVPPQQ